ncbi:GntR family transcriptional regulator [Microbacterium sp. B2969]|uniref:GntR family transcriptional regulator n=1 Tax=Microbacterium alkaliflavum TaxID=3248839 RepID=A0ABW7QCV8_9MICO
MLRGRLRDLIAELGPGRRLPSERDLSADWGVARMTLRGAVDELVAEGLLERRHGSGTYTVFSPVLRVIGLTSFTHDMRSRGIEPSSRILDFRTITADDALASRLHIPVGSPVFWVSRLRLGNAEPVAIESVRIPVSYAPQLTRADLEGSLYEVLAARHALVASAASMRIEPVLPDPASAELLGIGGDQACLRVRMVDTDRTGRVVMLATCLYRGDKYQLRAQVGGAVDGPGGAAGEPEGDS